MDRELNIKRLFIYLSKKEFEKFSKKLEGMTDAQVAELADKCKQTFYSVDSSSSYEYDGDAEHNWDFISDHRDEDFGFIPEEDYIEGF